jgi:hypothetical protein
VAQVGDRRTVLVAGRLEEAHIPDLLRACAAAAPVCLDLTDVLSADRVAVDALRRLRNDGVRLLGLPKYLEFQIGETA